MRHFTNGNDSVQGNDHGDSVLGLTPKATTTTAPNHDNWDSEIDLHTDELSYANKGNNSLSPISNVDDGEWVEMEVTVDSGACDTVMPVSSCSFKVLPSYHSRHDMEYEVANA